MTAETPTRDANPACSSSGRSPKDPGAAERKWVERRRSNLQEAFSIGVVVEKLAAAQGCAAACAATSCQVACFRWCAPPRGSAGAAVIRFATRRPPIQREGCVKSLARFARAPVGLLRPHSRRVLNFCGI